MPARANRRAPSYVWAAALAALAPNAFAQSPDQTPAPSTDAASPPEPRPVGYSWETDAIDCADAVGPWSSAVAVGAPLFAGLAYVDASPHALVLRHAPMAPFDPWVPVDDTPAAPDPPPGAHDVPLGAAVSDAPLVALDAAGAVEAQGDGDDASDEIPLPDPLAPQAARQRPGREAEAPIQTVPLDAGAVAPPQLRDLSACEPSLRGGGDYATACAPPVPDRWRLAENLGVVHPRWWDPYNQNTLKGDRPIFGTRDWFFIGSAISDTVIEPRSFPIPVGVQTTSRAGSLDVFGDANSLALNQAFIASAALVKGATAFKPQELEFHLTVVGNISHVEVEEKRILFVRPDDGTVRDAAFAGVQEAFVEDHLRNVSDRYDFDSLRVGIQPFSSDFRGFLFQDNQLGVRLFGTRNNNRFQYNLAAFARLEKDTNSGLNDVGADLRRDYVFIANAYRQDMPLPGITSQVTAVYNANRERDDVEIDANGFPVRPALIGSVRGREYDVGYVGYNADGRIGRLNLTASAYYAFGEDRASVFTGKDSVIRAYFVAVEPSIDFNWIRVRGSALYGSGDENPNDDREEGFDSIFENPQFAGADTSFWVRQSVPFIGGGRAVSLNGRNGILNSLRSSKEQGQSNFNNPGIALLGAGADVDVLPQLRVSANVNHLAFANTATLEALRMDGSIDSEIGWDVSAAATYRPGFIQNFVFRLSGAALVPGEGFKNMFASRQRDDFYYSVLFNATLSY